jgi:hypothetical protein
MVNKKIISLMAIIAFSCVAFSGCTQENQNADAVNWLDGYTPVHGIGSSEDDFWTVYPDMNPDAGKNVSHLQWVLDALQNSSVAFVVHQTGCTTCKPQADRVIALGEKYSGNLTVFDLDLANGGVTEQRGNNAYVYDPSGPPGYIALTGIFTIIKVNGQVAVGWHSWEGNVADMETWVKDAICYYHMSSNELTS